MLFKFTSENLLISLFKNLGLAPKNFWGAFAGAIGASLLGGIFGNRGANRRARGAYRERLKWAKWESKEDLAWKDKTARRSKYGSERFQQTKALALQPIKSQSQRTQQQAIGQAIRQGLENSVIAGDIRSRMDAKTQTQMSSVAQKLALMNEAYKEQQEQALDKYHFARSERIRSISGSAGAEYQQAKRYSSDIWASIFGQISQGMWSNLDWGELEGMQKPMQFGSDIRLKENIELVGVSPKGVNIYEFDYKNKSFGYGRYRGVMAQEVPNAREIGQDGFYRVDYTKVDVNFERIINGRL